MGHRLGARGEPQKCPEGVTGWSGWDQGACLCACSGAGTSRSASPTSPEPCPDGTGESREWVVSSPVKGRKPAAVPRELCPFLGPQLIPSTKTSLSRDGAWDAPRSSSCSLPWLNAVSRALWCCSGFPCRIGASSGFYKAESSPRCTGSAWG